MERNPMTRCSIRQGSQGRFLRRPRPRFPVLLPVPLLAAALLPILLTAAILLPVMAPASGAIQAASRDPAASADRGGVYYFGGSPSQDAEQMLAMQSAEILGAEIMTLWNDIEAVEGRYDTTALDRRIDAWNAAGRRVILRFASAHHATGDTPDWVFTKYGVRRIHIGPWAPFHDGEAIPDYEVRGRLQDGRLLADAAVEGAGAPFLETRPDRMVFRSGEAWLVQFDYQSRSGATLRVDLAGSETLDLPPTPADGTPRTVSLRMETGPGLASGAAMGWTILAGDMSVDNVNMVRESDSWFGTTVLPNYFDPEFQRLWARFIGAMAERYNGHPGVEAVVVGGFGRWEEVTLEDDEYGALRDQFPVYGYSDGAYLALLDSCLHLYLEAFPDKPLLMCAFGNGTDEYMDRTWFNVRSGQQAAALGVGLKYNGHHATVRDIHNLLYDRNAAGVDTYYETYHQYSREKNVGHPVSVASRAVLDGVRFLYLYGIDALDPKSLPSMKFANEALGGTALFSQFYARTGRFPFVGTQSQATVLHQDIFAGLRQKNGGDIAEVGNVEAGGWPAIATTNGNPGMRFDLLGTAVQSGLSGVAFRIRYLDQGTDRFEIRVRDYLKDEDRGVGSLATVRKTGTGAFREAVFLLREPMMSDENGRPDFASDFQLLDLGDGIETISEVSVSFAPLEGWKTRVVREDGAVPGETAPADTVEAGGRASVDVANNPLRPACRIRLPVGFVRLEDRGGVLARIEADRGSGFELVRFASLFMPAEREEFRIPVPTDPAVRTYRIVLEAEDAPFRWFLGAEDHPAVGLDTLETQDESESFLSGLPEGAGWTDLPADTEIVQEIRLDAVFCGFRLMAREAARLRLRLERDVGNGYEAAGVEGILDLGGEEAGSAVFRFAPQPAGRYRLAVSANGPVSLSALADGRVATALVPMPEASPLPARRSLWGKAAATVLSAGQDPVPGTVTLAGARFASLPEAGPVSGGGLRAILPEAPDWTLTLSGLSVQTRDVPVLRIQLANVTPASILEIQLSGAEDPAAADAFLPSHTFYVPVVPNDAILREYSLRLSAQTPFQGIVRSVRIRFPGLPAGQAGLGEVALHLGASPAEDDGLPLEPVLLQEARSTRLAIPAMTLLSGALQPAAPSDPGIGSTTAWLIAIAALAVAMTGAFWFRAHRNRSRKGSKKKEE